LERNEGNQVGALINLTVMQDAFLAIKNQKPSRLLCLFDIFHEA
jgi:hypothetical protein